MSAADDSLHQPTSTERLDSFRCNLDDIVLDSTSPENTSGAFGDLFTATHPTEGKLALKRPRGDLCDRKTIAAIEIEASVWTRLQHPRILRFLGICTILGDLYLVSVYAENGSLPGFLQHQPNVDRRRLVIEIAEGLMYLHQCGIIHGDLKRNNVLISNDEHVLICDFGLAKHVTSRTATTLRGVGSIAWQSPEMLQDAERKSFNSDVYAFGITIYEVLSGKEPYSHHKGLFSLITGVALAGERPPKQPLTAPDGSSYLELWEQAEKCWDADPTRRPSMLAVLRHLDPDQFEKLITTQQIELEASLDLVGRQQTRPQDLLLLPFTVEGQALEPLEWARRIQARVSCLHNSRQPIARLSAEIVGLIILIAIPSASPFNSERFITSITSWARLRTTCKAWCHAIDTTPEILRHIWVHSCGNNVGFALVRNPKPNCLLKCLVTTRCTIGLPPMESSFMEALAERVSELGIKLSTADEDPFESWPNFKAAFPNLNKLALTASYGTPSQLSKIPSLSFQIPEAPLALALEGLSFEFLTPSWLRRVHVLTMVNATVCPLFNLVFGTFLCVAPQISEVNLRSLNFDLPRRTRALVRPEWWPSISPTNHRALQRVSLIDLEVGLVSMITDLLENYQCELIEVGDLDPKDFSASEYPTIMSKLSSLPPGSDITFKRDGPTANVQWRTQEMSEEAGKGGSESRHLWRSGRIGFDVSDTGNLVRLFRSLSNLGLRRILDDFRIVTNLDSDNPPNEGNVKVMTLGPETVVSALEKLCAVACGELGSIRYPWPYLEELIITRPCSGPPQQGWDAIEHKLCHFVVWRQTVARHDEGRVSRLKKLGIPAAWIPSVEPIKRLSPDFSDIDIYATDGSIS